MTKTNYLNLSTILFLFFVAVSNFSCEKQMNEPRHLSEPMDKEAALIGQWQQTDVVLAVDVDKKSGLVSNSSVVTNAYLIELGLGVAGFGQAMTFSQYTALSINEDGTYSFENDISNDFATFLMPKSGVAGKWNYDKHISVLQLTPDGATEYDPHWIDKITNTELTLSVLLDAGGQQIPLYVKYKKVTGNEEDLTDQRNQLIDGNWFQKDIQFAMTIPKDALGMEIPKGTSLIEMAPLLAIALGNPALAEQIQLTGLNTFSFSGGNYSFKNPLTDDLVKFLLPGAGTSGGAQVIAKGDVIGFQSSGGGTPDVHVIDQLDENTFSFAITITVPGAGTLPFNLVLQKASGVTAAQRMPELVGTWTQKDLVFAVDIPADALGFPIPKGTSLMDLVNNPAVASQLDPVAVAGIKLMPSSYYSFGSNGMYSFTNPLPQVIETLFPKGKGSGQWMLLGGDNLVLGLFRTADPGLHWINSLGNDEVSMRVALDVGGMAIPLNLILKKEDIDPFVRAGWLAGTWHQDDLQLGLDVPANALFPGQPALPKGTSLLALVQDPAVAGALGAQTVGAIQATAYSSYSFGADNTYAFSNPADPMIIGLMFPVAGLAGDWSFINGGTALSLKNGANTQDVQVVEMSENEIVLAVTLSDGGALEIPANLILKK